MVNSNPRDGSGELDSRETSKGQRLLIGLILVALAVVAVGALLPGVGGPRGFSPRSKCSSNLRRIALALQDYHKDYGCFPPAWIADANGKPMHSWRVLILPYMEHKMLYQEYNLDEPWDGPENLRLSNAMPEAFRCPVNDKAGPSETSYVAIVGVNTAWDPSMRCTISSFAAGGAETVMVIESAHCGIHWMEPRDLPLSVVTKGIDPPGANGINSGHRGVCQAAFADGSVRPISKETKFKTFEALFTRGAGDSVPNEF